MPKDELDELLQYDSLNEAEKVTGESYKESEATTALGVLLALRKNEMLRAALTERGDTHFNTTAKEYLSIAERIGFEVVLTSKFPGTYANWDYLFILFHRRWGVLLKFDTFSWESGRESSVNGGNFYYNWTPNNGQVIYDHTLLSSGHWNREGEPIWVGSHDCREALVHNLAKLNNKGQFVVPWVEPQHMWLVGYGERASTRENVVEGIRESTDISYRRYLSLPSYVRDVVKHKEPRF